MTGERGINPARGRPPRKFTPEQEGQLGAYIRSRPGVTLAQVQAWLMTEHHLQLSTGAMWNAARRLGLSFKKRLAGRRAEQAGCGSSPQAVEGCTALH